MSLNYATNLFSGNSESIHEHVEAETIRNRDELVFIPPSMQQINTQFHVMPGFSDGNTFLSDPQFVSKQPLHAYSSEQNPQNHGLSLSLGSRVPSSVQGPSDFNQYTNSNLSSSFSQINGLKNVEYLSFDLAQGTTSSVHEATGITGTFWSSKYLSAARDLLDEVVSVYRALDKPERRRDFNSLGRDGSIGLGTDMKGDRMSSEPRELSINASCEISPSERQDLQNRLNKLLSMLDEVDTRYKNYHNQMQIMVSSFEMVAGRGAARPYTTLAGRTISSQFRSLRDAIKRQIQVTQNTLGEQDVTSRGQGVLSRLRFVDQQLRQQKAFQQFGITGQPWRPQRGLPENAVSVLRSWLFEHFLHPYPKDSEKIILAKQTGLTRSQVANWFINARVRLWKPMIEDMYKEEFADADADAEPKTSPEHAVAGQERSDVISSSEWNVNEANLSYQAGPYQENEFSFGQLHHDKILNMADHRMFSDDVSMPSNTIGNQVSLALGLQHSEKNPRPISGESQPSEDDATDSSMGLDKLEYRYVDPVNQQHRFSNPHLLSDFVT